MSEKYAISVISDINQVVFVRTIFIQIEAPNFEGGASFKKNEEPIYY